MEKEWRINRPDKSILTAYHNSKGGHGNGKKFNNTNNTNKNSSYNSSYANEQQNSKNAERAKNTTKNKNMNKTSDCHTKDYSDYNNGNY
ncbi:MAG: hypothetical protein ACLUUO_10375 [Sellimonas intestinalis]